MLIDSFVAGTFILSVFNGFCYAVFGISGCWTKALSLTLLTRLLVVFTILPTDLFTERGKFGLDYKFICDVLTVLVAIDEFDLFRVIFVCFLEISHSIYGATFLICDLASFLAMTTLFGTCYLGAFG